MQRQVQVLISALLMLLFICSQALAGGGPQPNKWTGSGPFATGLGNKVITALAVSPDSGTVYAGTMSGTVLSYAVTPPTAVTGAANGIAATAATLNGIVNPLDAGGEVFFEYGSTTAYGSGRLDATPHDVSGSADMPVSLALTGLNPNTDYHFRVIVETTSGTTYGDDQVFTTLKLNQATLAITAPTTMTFGDPDANITTSGGSGSGGITFDAGSSTACSIVTGKLHVISATGSCSITATKATDATYYAAISAVFNVTINKANQSSFTITGPAALTFGVAGATITNSGGNGTGAVTYSHGSSTACTVDSDTGAVTVTSGTGTCAITATKAADNNYNSLTSPAITITINKSDQATFILNGLPVTAEYNQSGIMATVSGGSSTGAVSYSHGTSTACAVNSSSGAVSITSGSGTCTISAIKAADANYNSITTAAATITVSPANQQTLVITGLPATAAYNQGGIIASTTGGTGTGVVTYGHGSSTACTIDPATGAVTITSGTGTCTITATKAADDNYNLATSVPVTVSIIKAAQAAIAVTAPTSMTFGDADATITTSGGSGSGGITFDASSSTACSIVAGKLHVISATGSCSITATKATDSNYYPTTSAAFAVSMNKATQSAFTITGPAAMTFGDADAIITTSGGSGSGAITFDAGSSSACSIVSGKLHVISGTGACSITASKDADSNYNQTTSVPFTVNLTKAGQATLSVTGPGSITFGAADADITISGGSGSGTVTFDATGSTACSIVSGKLHVTAGTGTCSITATKATDNDYSQTTSTPFTVTVSKTAQATLAITGPSTMTYGDADTSITTTGGSGSGAVTFDAGSSSACSIVNGKLHIITGTGTCSITASKAGDNDYTAVSSVSAPVTVNKAAQTISLATSITKTYGDPDFGPDAIASSGLPVTYSIVGPAVATVTDTGLIHIIGAGGTGITVNQAGNADYLPVTTGQGLLVNKAMLLVTANNASRPAGTDNPLFSVTYSGFVNGDTATVFSSPLTFMTPADINSPAGEYLIIPIMSGPPPANYNPVLMPGMLAVGLQSQIITFRSLPVKTYGDAQFTLDASSTTGNPILFGVSDLTVATISGNTVTIVGPGTTVIAAIQPGDTSYATGIALQTLTVNKPTLTVTADNLQKAVNDPVPPLTYAVSGFVNGENQGTACTGAPQVDTAANAASPVGSYPIAVAAGTLVCPKYDIVYANGVLAVGLQSQNIDFVPLNAMTYGDAAFALSATGGASGNPVTFESTNPAVATVSGATVTITGAGSATIVARQTGNDSYAPASAVQVLTVRKKSLTVTADVKSRVYNAANPALTFSYSGFAYSDTQAALVGAPELVTSAATNSTVGSYPITIASGNLSAANYDFTFTNAVLTVSQATPVITWSKPADITYGAPLDGTQLNATADVAGTIIYTPASGIVLGAGSAQTLSAAFTPTDTVNYTAASKTVAINVNKASQTITFSPPASATYGETPITFSASATSGLSVAFAVSSGPGSLTGNVLTITGAGDIVVTASQAGSNNYSLASSVQRTIVVGKAAATVTLGSLNHTYDGTAKGATASTSPTGRTVTFAYNGSATAPTAAGSYSVIATISDANYQGSASGTLTIGSSAQAITFGTAPTVFVGTIGTLSATATSGLAVTFTSTTPAICTVSGTTVTGIAPGVCTIVADQAGNGNYTAASQVTQDIPVTVSITLSVSALADGATTTETTQNISGTVTNPSYLSTLTINGAAVTVTAAGSFSFPVQLIAGANTITVIATSTAGDVLTDSRTVTLDTTVLQLVISAPADNTVVNQSYTTVSGTVTPATAVTITCAVNGGTPQAASISGGDFSCTSNLIQGMNTIVINATDGSHSAQAKRTVTYAPTFTLAITDPASDVRTVKSSYLLTGTVAGNTTPVNVTITMDGQTYSAAVVNSSFSQALTFNAGKVYQITVAGTDQNGNTVTVQRNIIYSTPTVAPFTIEDALKALQMAVGVIPPQAGLVQRLDVAPMVNGVSVGDGIIDVEDAIVILRIVVGLI